MEDGGKVVIGAAIVGLAGWGIYRLTRPAEAVPPEEPLPGTATVYGILPCSETGAPLAGVSVSLWSPDETEFVIATTTNGAGSYSLVNILPGNYLIYFQKEGFETLRKDIILVEGLNELNIQLVPITHIPEIVIDFPELTILEVEGTPFISVGVEEEAPLSWEAFGECLQRKYGPAQYFEGWIKNGVGLAMCMKAKGAATGATLKQCGFEHPEYLTSYSNRIPPPRSGLLGTVTNFIDTYGVTPYACLTIQFAGIGHLHVDSVAFLPPAGEDCVWHTLTYTTTYWEQSAPHQQMVNGCIEALAPIPFEGPVATLAEPIEMSKMRGVILSWLNKTIPTYADCGTIWILQYRPTFSAEMPPPGFRLISLGNPAAGETKIAPITGCYAGGYYYPGVYDGIITVEAGCGYRDGSFTSYAGGGQFKIKNLIRVTGTGTVVPGG